MESFVEDLLNLRMLREGNFTIAKDRFNPTEIFDCIVRMFYFQARAKGITISYKVVNNLELPDSSCKLNLQSRESPLI